MTLLKNNDRAVLFFLFHFLFYFIPQQFIILHLNLRNCFNWFLVGVIIFSSVRFLSKKITKLKLFFLKKKNRNRTETGSNRPVSVRFGFLGKNRFKPVWLGFSGFGSVFSVLARFFFCFGSVFLVFCL